MTTPLSDADLKQIWARWEKGIETAADIEAAGDDIPHLLAEVERLRAENTGLQHLADCQANYVDGTATVNERLRQCRDDRKALRARNAELEEQNARWQVMVDRIAGQSADYLLRAREAERRIAELVAVLRSVEWNGQMDEDEFGNPMATCPRCDAWRPQGHAPDCALDAALRGEQ